MAKRQDASTGKIVDAPEPTPAELDTEEDKKSGKKGKKFGKKSASGKETLSTKVYSPFRVYYDEEAYSVSAVNATGPFDILPHHHNFITLLEACELKIQSLHGETPVRISGGIMHVHEDKVTVFLDV